MKKKLTFSLFLGGGDDLEGSFVGTDCSTDYLSIPCATNSIDPYLQNGTPSVCVDRICGMVFNSARTQSGSPNVPIRSYSKPFNIRVHTDREEGNSNTAEASNRGFCLQFVQQPCNSATGK